jgi:Zn-dependent protease with chaperone function
MMSANPQSLIRSPTSQLMSPTPDSAAASRTVGPRDRESFFIAQKRNRRATWRMSGLAVISALVMGLPLTLVLTPLVYAVALIVIQIVNYISPLPPELWRDVDGLGRLAVSVGDYIFNHKPVDTPTLVLGIGAVLGPGIILSLVLWMVMLALFRRGGVGGALVSMNARPPNKDDLQELQLFDVVEEMAIAAGLPVPQVMVVESGGANAAAVGTSPSDACVVVSRRLLNDLHRDELQGVVAELIASIGNGDLKIAFTVTSIFETCGLLVALINAPFGPQARGALWKTVRFGLSRSSTASGSSADAEAVAAILTRNLALESTDIDRYFDSTGKKSPLRKLLDVVFFPIFLTNTTIRLTMWVFSGMLLGPCIALVWRARRYLADASAVQLTRYPDGLASALRKLGSDSSAMPGGAWASHLFVVAPSGDTSVTAMRPNADEVRAAMRAWAGTRDESTGALPVSVSSPAAPSETDTGIGDYNRLRTELLAAQVAAMRGDARAVARLAAFGQAISIARTGEALSDTPSVADIAAARQGDHAAVARLRSFNQRQGAVRQAEKDTSSFQAVSLLSFHPSLKRRLKRLERMGAQVSPESSHGMGGGARVVLLVLGLVIGPLLLVAAGLMLVLIAMLTMFNLMMMAVWLVAIREFFILLGHR